VLRLLKTEPRIDPPKPAPELRVPGGGSR
jgi:hypothetical protein